MSIARRKSLMAFAIAGTMLALAGCSSSDTRQERSDPDIDSVIEQPEQQGYRNIEAGYTLMYPQSWQSGVIQRDTLEWQEETMDAENMVVFYYRNVETNSTPAPLLALTVYSLEQWEQMQSQEMNRARQPTGHVIEMQDDQVLVAYINSRNPFDSDSRQGQAFASRVLTPEQVKEAVSW